VDEWIATDRLPDGSTICVVLEPSAPAAEAAPAAAEDYPLSPAPTAPAEQG